MIGWRALALSVVVAAAGALGTLAVGAAAGMGRDDLVHLAAYLVPAMLVTLLAMAIARPLLSRASLRQRFTAVAAVGVLVGVANLVVLGRTMFVSTHDATLVGVLLLYSIGAGMGSALVIARASSSALDRLAVTARALGEGDLEARVGELEAGSELDALAGTLDEMADRLRRSQEREHETETTRRDLDPRRASHASGRCSRTFARWSKPSTKGSSLILPACGATPPRCVGPWISS